MVKVIFLGPPGAGKGTQSKEIATSFEIPHISTGDILRQAVANQTELGKAAHTYMEEGELFQDSLILDLIRDRLAQPDAQKGWILDGFPRNLTQAKFLNDLLGKIGMDYDSVVNLEVPDQILVERLVGRGRNDDTKEVIEHRLDVYREQTAPVIGFYQNLQKLVLINGNQALEDVTKDIYRKLALSE